MADQEVYHVDCQCMSEEHTIRFVYSPEENEVYTSVYLNNFEPWYKRIWLAIRYIFKFKPSYGHFDCTVLKPDDVLLLDRLWDRVIDEEARKAMGI